MSITSDLLRGHTDTMILSQLIKGDTYGYAINKVIKENTNNMYELKEATLYSSFRRLEQAGYIYSYWGNEDKGARRRYYTITDLGIKAYNLNKKDWQEAKNLIDTLIGEEG